MHIASACKGCSCEKCESSKKENLSSTEIPNGMYCT